MTSTPQTPPASPAPASSALPSPTEASESASSSSPFPTSVPSQPPLISASSAPDFSRILPATHLRHHFKQQQQANPHTQKSVHLESDSHRDSVSSSSSSGIMSATKPQSSVGVAAAPVRRSLVKEFALGGIATSAACLFTNPIEVVKTRLQVQGELSARAGRASSASGPYRNWAHALYTVGRLEGVRGLWAGIGPAVLYQLSMNGTRLGSYEHFKRMYTNVIDEVRASLSDTSASSSALSSSQSNAPKMLPNVLAGATAGAVAAFLGSPFFLVKVRLQTQFKKSHSAESSSVTPQAHAAAQPASTSSSSTESVKPARSVTVGHQYAYRSSFDALRQIVSAEGVAGLFRGVQAAVARVSIGSGVQLSTYDYSKHLVMTYGGLEGTPAHFSASLVTGFFVTLAMNPPDVLTTRMYNQPLKDGKPLLYKGLVDCFLKTVRAEGPFALYKGFVAHYARLGPHTILTFVFWEKVKKLADQFGW